MKTTLRIAALVAALLIPTTLQARTTPAASEFCGNSGHYCASISIQATGGTHRQRRHHEATHRERRERHREHKALDANGAPAAAPAVDPEALAWAYHTKHASRGFIRSAKTGATASISTKYEERFQALLDDLEAWSPETKVYYMGGYRPGHCSPAHQHSCNLAIDYCQDSRGVVSGARDCHLPPPAEFHKLVAKHHLHDGSVWCNGDFGHVQALDSGGCNVAAHGKNGGVLYTITGNAVQIASAREHRRHTGRRYAHRHHRYRVADRG